MQHLFGMIASEREIEFVPHGDHGLGQLPDQPNVMRRRRSNPQSLGATANRWIVDRLDVDPVPVKQKVARLLAEIGIADHDRDDMGLRRHYGQARFPQCRLGRGDCTTLARTLFARCLEMNDRGCRSRGYRGWQRRCEDKSGSVGSDGVHHGALPAM